MKGLGQNVLESARVRPHTRPCVRSCAAALAERSGRVVTVRARVRPRSRRPIGLSSRSVAKVCSLHILIIIIKRS